MGARRETSVLDCWRLYVLVNPAAGLATRLRSTLAQGRPDRECEKNNTQLTNILCLQPVQDVD